MLKKIAMLLLTSTLAFTACSGSDLSDFQENSPDPDFTLLTMMDPWESLEEILDTVLSKEVNRQLGAAADAYPDEFVDFLAITREIIQTTDAGDPAHGLLIDNLMSELEQMTGYLIDPSRRHYENAGIDSFYSQNGSSGDYLSGFYSFLDKISQGEANIGGDVTAMGHSLLKYILDNSNDREIQNTVQSLVDTVQDPDFKDDVIDISKTLSKLLIRGDYPMWVEEDGDLITNYNSMSGGTNTGLGNMVQGTVSLIQGLSKIMMYDPVAKELLFDIIRESASLVSENNAVKLEKLVCNLEDHFTAGGAVYASDEYNNPVDDTGLDDGIYVNAEMGNTLREMWPSVLKLLIGGQPDAQKNNYAIFNDDQDKSPLEYVVRKISDLKSLGIDFSSADYANGELERGVLDMFIKDGMGRDRKTDPEAYDVSYLDHLLFALVEGYNFGYLTRDGDDGEPVGNHGYGHGETTGGTITTNDCLYSLGNGYLLLEAATSAYVLALAKRLEQADHMGRSSRSFKAPGDGEAMLNKFYMGYDYPPMLLLPSACAGDSGIPNGGTSCRTPNSNETVVGGNNDYRTYYPRVGSGIGELNTSRFVMGWIARACWSGEGPYYFAPEKAGQSTTTLYYDYDKDGTAENFSVYNNPNGGVYALVHKPNSNDASTWVYIYPTNDTDAEEVGDYYSNEDPANKGKVRAEELAINAGAVSHVLYHSPVVPGTIKIERTAENTYSFATGEITWNNGGAGNRTVVIDGQLPNRPISEGSITRVRIKERYNWLSNPYNDTADIFFRVNADGTLTHTYENGNPVASAHNSIQSSDFNYETGEFYASFRNVYSWTDENEDGIISEDEKEYLNYTVNHIETWYEYVSAIAVDDGHGNISGTAFSGQGHIDYGTGEITGTLTADSLVYCDYTIDTLSIPGTVFDGKRQRSNRYRSTWKSDYYMLEEGSRKNYCRPPMTENGSRYVEGTSGEDKYLLLPGKQRASRFTFTEKISEKSAVRECASQEEAMVRNFQWLMLEKKNTFIIPMWVKALGLIHSASFIIIEGNGVLGLANARPGEATGRWLYDRANNGEGSRPTNRSPEYYESDVPGDARIIVFVREHNLLGTLGMNLGVIWDNILGRGHVLPDAVGANIPPIPRMAFLQEKLVPSDATGDSVDTYSDVFDGSGLNWSSGSWNDAWRDRNRVFPAVIALAGSLHDRTYYDAATDGYDYNWDGNHKYPLKDLLGGLVPPLAKPMFRHFDDEGGRWVGRINQGYSSGTEEDSLAYLSPIFTAPGISGQADVDPINIDHRPRRGLRTLTSFLAENETKQCDGLVPLMAEKSIVTKFLVMLQRMGDNDLLSGLYGNDTGNRHARHDLFSGLEQLATAVKTTKGEVIEQNWTDQNFNADKWKWMFATGQNMNDEGEFEDYTDVRDVDIVLDDLIYALVGHDYMNIAGTEYEGKGLAAIPDDSQRAVDERLTTTGLVVQDSLGNGPIPGSLVIGVEGETETATDDGGGVITGDLVVGKGYINYNTGDIYFIIDSDVVGASAAGRKVQCSYTFSRNWSDFYDAVADMEEFLSADGKYAILENLIHLMDGLFSTQRDFTDQEVAGVLYTAGKLLAQYDGSKWVYQGEDDFSNNNLYTILTQYLPQLHEVIKDDTGHNYGVMMTLMADMMKPGGLLEAVMDSAYSSAEYAQLMKNLHEFLIEATTPGSSINVNIWRVVVDLLEDLGGAVEDYNEAGDEGLRELFEKYGFQYNG